MYLDALNRLTTSQYGFTVSDWDNRPMNDNTILGKHSFCPKDSNAITNQINYVPISLHDLNIEKVGEIFNKIFQTYKNKDCEFHGIKYQPTSIYLRVTSDNQIPDEPFLFVVGSKKKEQSSL